MRSIQLVYRNYKSALNYLHSSILSILLVACIQQFFELLLCSFLIVANNPSRKTALFLSSLKYLLIVFLEVSELTVSESNVRIKVICRYIN